MSNIKSTLMVLSNLWPREGVYKDYLDHIHDFKAIEFLENTCNMQKIHDYKVDEERRLASYPCVLNNKYVFGHRGIRGKKETQKLVCICDNTRCKHYEECSKLKEK